MKKGDPVMIVSRIVGIQTEEPGTVLMVDKQGVWTDNGPGNDPTGPFDLHTLQWELNDIIPMSRMWIRPHKEPG